MELVQSKDFIDYFLMLSDAVRFAKDTGVPVGPARGSAAASLACYLLRITEVDPLQFPTMVFERFIDATRMDLPDIDLDFADDRRDEVRLHLVRRYGADHVGNIGNFTRYKGKNSIDDVARVYGIPKWEAETIKDLVIERSGGDSRVSDSLEDTFHMFPKAAAVLERYPQLRQAIRLEGNYRGMSVHAAGIVVSNTPITDVAAVYTRESGGRMLQALAYDKKDAEYLGMLKADFLGLKTMGMIGIALDQIGMTLEELYAIPLDDRDTLAAFKRNDVVGIFQFEGRATRVVCADVSPDNFMHLADINALSRPGPLFSGMTAQYVDVRHGRKPIELLHPIVDKVTAWSYGQIVYQEQVLTIIKEMGGFPVTKIADIRKIISQKLGEMSFQKMYEEFLDGAYRLHGVDKDLATRIWKFMVTSATYSFNVAHCVSYSMLAFWQMWIKVHHPLAFYAASLAKLGDGKKEREYKRPRLLSDAVSHGIKILPPHLAISGKNWTPDPAANAVRAGFTQIDGIGASTYASIARTREERPFEDWADLIRVKGIGPKGLVKIRAFCESPDPFGLELVGRLLGEYRKGIENEEDDFVGLPVPTHTSDEIPRQGEHQITWIGMVRSINYQNFVENKRTRTGDAEEKIIAEMKDPHLVDSCVLRCYDDGGEDVYVRINRWAFPRFKQLLEGIKINHDVIIATGKKREDFGVSIHTSSLVVIDPDDDDADEEESEDGV
jgi:DNA polymerase-3 subunit alpha